MTNSQSKQPNIRKAQLVMVSMLKTIDAICEREDIKYWIDGGTLLGAVRHAGFIPWDDDIDIVMPRADYEKFARIAPYELPEDMYLQTREQNISFQLMNLPCKLRDGHSRVRELDMPEGVVPDLGLFIDVVPLDAFHRHGIGRKFDAAFKWIHYKLCGFLHAKISDRKDTRTKISNILVRLRPILGIAHWLRWYRLFLVNVVARHNNRTCNDHILGYGFDTKVTRIFEINDIFPLQRLTFEGHAFQAPKNTDAILTMFYGDYMTIPPKEDRVNMHSNILEIGN